MVRTMIAPNRYIQGPRVLVDVARYISHLGTSVFFIAGSSAWSAVNEQISRSLGESSMPFERGSFEGLCTRAAASRLSEEARSFGAHIVAGVGGGAVIDVAKAVSHELGTNLVIIPTVASSDAPCSALSVQYNENHVIDRFLKLRRNPDVVLVDSRIISEAPTRFFVAGMGDALATWFEANTCTKSGALNVSGGLATSAALSLARLCYDTLMEYGESAKLAVDQKAVTPAVEKVIEANILLSGLGFESGGLSSAHGIHEGLVALEETKGMMHGELVAFGAISLLVLENYPRAEIDRVMNFCISVGLPVTLRQLGIDRTERERVEKAARVACGEGLTTHNTYFKIDPDVIMGAILGADALGEQELASTGKGE
jgi:glycerol dehydrogenase